MADKKVALETLDARFTKLEHLIERGFAATAEDISKVAAKEDVWAVQYASEFDRAIKRRLTHFEDNVSGYRKEIDDALERIGVIEKHLGIERKIVADHT
jgi:hypothetical protein